MSPFGDRQQNEKVMICLNLEKNERKLAVIFGRHRLGIGKEDSMNDE